jgi:S1-C subfamily serine protease
VSSIQFVDALLADADRDQRAERGPSDAEALDAYSQVVSGVAERVIGSVASLRISRRLPGGRQAQGAGSAVAITPDGFLVTSAHVVEGVGKGRASLADGRELRFEVVGRDALSDLAVIRAGGADLEPVSLGNSGSASSSWPSATRWGWPARSPPGWSARSAARSRPATGGPAGCWRT